MVELLTRHTSMPVVEANRVYIILPSKNMTFAGGVLRLTGSCACRTMALVSKTPWPQTRPGWDCGSCKIGPRSFVEL
jgi:hypothetical protein